MISSTCPGSAERERERQYHEHACISCNIKSTHASRAHTCMTANAWLSTSSSMSENAWLRCKRTHMRACMHETRARIQHAPKHGHAHLLVFLVCGHSLRQAEFRMKQQRFSHSHLCVEDVLLGRVQVGMQGIGSSVRGAQVRETEKQREGETERSWQSVRAVVVHATSR